MLRGQVSPPRPFPVANRPSKKRVEKRESWGRQKLTWKSRVHHKNQPLHGKNRAPKDWQVAFVPWWWFGFLLFIRVVSGDYGKPSGRQKLTWKRLSVRKLGWYILKSILEIYEGYFLNLPQDSNKTITDIVSSWWFQKFFILGPYLGKMMQFD